MTQAPIGEATTVVHATELSEPAVECAVEAGHTYVKVGGNEGPDLRFEARPSGAGGPAAIFGDRVQADGADFTARVLRGSGRTLLVLKDGQAVEEVPVSGDDFEHRFASSGPGRYGLRLMREQNVETVGTPIWVEPGPGRIEARSCSPLRVRGSVRRRVRRGAFRARCSATGDGLRACSAAAIVQIRRGGGVRRRTIGRGQVAAGAGRVERSFRLRLNRRGRRLVRRHPRGRRFRVVFTAHDGDGAKATDARRTRFRRRR